MHIKHAVLLKLKHAALFLIMQLVLGLIMLLCRFSTCKITPDNFPATKKRPHPFFSHS